MSVNEIFVMISAIIGTVTGYLIGSTLIKLCEHIKWRRKRISMLWNHKRYYG